MRLPYDYARCMGENQLGACPKRETCARYQQRDKTGPRTPFYERMCSGMGDAYENYVAQQQDAKAER